MAINVSRDECLKQMDSLTKMVSLNSDLEVISKFTNEIQFKAYANFKKHQTFEKVIKLVFKIVSEISVIAGAVTAVVQIFI